MEWLPYELRPEPVPLPDVSGADSARYQAGWKNGVEPMAAQLGLEMHFPPFKPRSRLAHEAAEAAREQGHFEAMRTALFQAYFVANRDIGSIDVLVEVGASIGLDAEKLRSDLEGGTHTARIEELEGVSARMGVRAVPTIVIGGLAVEGARPYPVLERVLEEARRRAAVG